MNEQLPEQPIIGYVEPRPLPVTVRREPDVGIAWEACCDALGLCALGKTPGEAAASLGAALQKRGLVDQLNVDQAAVDALVAKDTRSMSRDQAPTGAYGPAEHACPKCNAAPGEPCKNQTRSYARGWPCKNPHRERVAWMRAIARYDDAEGKSK